MHQPKKPVDAPRYESPKLITYGKVEDLTQMPTKEKPGNGNGNGNGNGGGNGGGGNNNKNPGAQDGSKSKIL